jgi:hypothetical protein
LTGPFLYNLYSRRRRGSPTIAPEHFAQLGETTIAGFGDHLPPDWLITLTAIRIWDSGLQLVPAAGSSDQGNIRGAHLVDP